MNLLVVKFSHPLKVLLGANTFLICLFYNTFSHLCAQVKAQVF
jgi:hypothetical protein